VSLLKQLLNSSLLAGALSIPAAYAHSPLLHSEPGNGATLEAPPAQIKLEFKNPVKLVLIRFSGGNMDQKLRPKSLVESDEHSLILPELSAGNYKAAWRAIGKDGHVMKGSIEFSVRP